MAEPETKTQVITDKLTGSLGKGMFAARWIMAPVYLGMLGALILVALKFLQKLLQTVPEIWPMSVDDSILVVLKLIDLALVGNLVLIVMFAGWENFIAPLGGANLEEGPTWAAKLDFTATKLKLVASVAAIAAVQMLETFMDIRETPKDIVLWQLALLIGFAATGVLLALMDTLSAKKE
jgi:uncharacterized protein (TIGR00645 family)